MLVFSCLRPRQRSVSPECRVSSRSRYPPSGSRCPPMPGVTPRRSVSPPALRVTLRCVQPAPLPGGRRGLSEAEGARAAFPPQPPGSPRAPPVPHRSPPPTGTYRLPAAAPAPGGGGRGGPDWAGGAAAGRAWAALGQPGAGPGLLRWAAPGSRGLRESQRGLCRKGS